MPIPTLSDVQVYLATAGMGDAESGAVSSAYLTEKQAQATRCRVPLDAATWPADLAEALCRRIAVNLEMRTNKTGFVPGFDGLGTPTAVRLGGKDPVVERLEGPYRKRVFA